MSDFKSLPKFAITTPLYYVNDVPHIGSAYPTMAADAAARFARMRGRAVRFVTGTDEHGLKIQRSAAARGKQPIEHCDEIVQQFQGLWQKLEIQYDSFIRTTDPKHEAIVREFFQRLWDQGDIYLNQQQGWYCVSCEEFKEERELLEGNRCPIHTNKEVEWRDEANYFFRLSKYQEKLEALYRDRPDFVQPEARRNEVLGFVSQGLSDFSISRVNFDWGIPFPFDANHIIYVWVDALLGYVTALLEPDQEPTLANAIAKWYPIDIHLIGKDILRFHAVYWQAMLMSAQLPPSGRVFGHGFLTKDGQKMGKTTGNTIDPYSLVEKYGADSIRYYFLKEIELGKDGDFNEARFIDVVNADLANDLGNLLNRTLGMVHRYCQGFVPAIAPIGEEHPLKAYGIALAELVSRDYENLAFAEACRAINHLVKISNKYIDEQAPWQQHKLGNKQTVAMVLYSALESVRLAAYLLAPITPNLSSAVYRQLGWDTDFNCAPYPEFTEHSRWGILQCGQKLPAAEPVFQKLEMS
jgi:methionyl-tRNA synthetase